MDSTNLPWPEKHRPSTMKELVGNPDQLKGLSTWLESWSTQSSQQRAALLIGPPGVGKTASVNALANDLGMEIVEFNASDSRNKAQIESLVWQSAMQHTLDGSLRLILLDEVDGLSGTSDRGGVGAIIKIIETTGHPIIMTANDPESPRLKDLFKKCRVFTFNTISHDDMLIILKRIIKRQKITIEESVLDEVVYNSGGDLRAAISDLELISKGGVSQFSLAFRDTRRNAQDTLTRLFMATDMETARQVLSESDVDHDKLLLWLEENVPLHLVSSEELERGMETLSQADLYLGRIWRGQNWKLLAYFYNLIAAGIPSSRSTTPFTKTMYSQPAWPLLVWQSNMSERNQSEIRSRLSRVALVSKKRVARTHQDIIKQIVDKSPAQEKKFSEWLNLKRGTFGQRGSRRSRPGR